MIQFNTGFNIVKDGISIAEEMPGNIILHTGVNDRGVWINEFTHIIARTGPIPVLNSTKTGIEPPVGKLPIGANQVVITSLYLAGWVHIARCQVSWFPVCAIIKNGRIETGVRSEEHTSELQSLMRISYPVFCLKKKNKQNKN